MITLLRLELSFSLVKMNFLCSNVSFSIILYFKDMAIVNIEVSMSVFLL